jgi:hypothetical protein
VFGFADGFCDGRLAIVIKDSVVIKVGSLLMGGSDVGELLGFGLGASLLGSSVIGDDVGFDKGFRVVGLEEVGALLVGI